MEVIQPVRRGDVFLVDLGAARGREVRKTRPCVVVSPDDLNAGLGTIVLAPLTTGAHPYTFRVPCRFAGTDGYVLVDQVRAVDRERVLKRLGALTGGTVARVLAVLRELFSV